MTEEAIRERYQTPTEAETREERRMRQQRRRSSLLRHRRRLLRNYPVTEPVDTSNTDPLRGDSAVDDGVARSLFRVDDEHTTGGFASPRGFQNVNAVASAIPIAIADSQAAHGFQDTNALASAISVTTAQGTTTDTAVPPTINAMASHDAANTSRKRTYDSIAAIMRANQTPEGGAETTLERQRRLHRRRVAVYRFSRRRALIEESKEHHTVEGEESKIEETATRYDDDESKEDTAFLSRTRSARGPTHRRCIALKHQQDFDPLIISGRDTVGTSHSLGPMNKVCPHCRCYKWEDETPALCCANGAVSLPLLTEPPHALKELYDKPDFLRNVRAYNMLFAFTSLGASVSENLRIDEELANGRDGVYTFRIQGTLCHRIGSLRPAEGCTPAFAQIYIHDADMERQADTRTSIMSGLNRAFVQQIQRVLDEVNPFVHVFKCVGLELQRCDEVHLRIFENVATDLRRYNRPTSNEIAALIVDGSAFDRGRDLILYPRHGGRLRRIFETWSQYDPLQYPLLLPFGELGWCTTTQYLDGRSRYGSTAMSAREFYAFRLFVREGEYSLILRGGRLFQQYCVDQYAKMEQGRLRFVLHHQRNHRIEVLGGLQDMAWQDYDLNDVGRRVILPANFTGSERYMKQHYYDSMAIVRAFGKPDLFITITCNPNWPEISNNLFRHQKASDRPDLVARVFRLKLKAIMRDIVKLHVFGDVLAFIYVIEYQKRGLPHAHLVLKLCEAYRPRCTADYDKFVSAEIPDPVNNRALYEGVAQHMMHGPCGRLNPRAQCMKDGKCSKRFPKPFCSETRTDDGGYPQMIRRDDGRTVLRSRVELDNRWVVGYNPYLLCKYNCHINVEICSTVTSIKYLYKYVYKGSDRARVTIGRRGINEIEQFQDVRYISNVEACWRLLEFPTQEKSHSVTRLPVHLENCQYVCYQPGENREDVLERSKHTMLTRFFELCSHDPIAATLAYHEIPMHYVWAGKTWKKRQRAKGKNVGRMVSCSPLDIERYHLRMLLCYVKGPKSFEDIRTVNGVVHDSYKEAARAHGFLEDDTEWHRCLSEAATFQMPLQLRHLFATILVYCQPADVRRLWDSHLASLTEDYCRALEANASDRRVVILTLKDINMCLISNNKCLGEYPALPQLQEFEDVEGQATVNRLLLHEQSYSRAMLEQVTRKSGSMNSDQKAAFDTVLEAVRAPEPAQRYFFLDGPGGTGKSFVLEQILATARLSNIIVLAVASSGIASLLLMGGRTVHSRFKLPLKLTETAMCSVPKQSHLAQLLQQTRMIVWDEAPMSHRYALEAIDRTLRDLMDNDLPFGGKIMLLTGDFRQILPVVPRASDGQVIGACLKKSDLWCYFRTLRLEINMRVRRAGSQGESAAIQEFSDFLLTIGEGRHAVHPSLGPTYFKVPSDFVLQPATDETDREAIIKHVYAGIRDHYLDDEYFHNRMILAPVIVDVTDINNDVMALLPGVEHVYRSIDGVEEEEGLDETLYQQELLNGMNPPGMPAHVLRLRDGAPIMLIRNINGEQGLCNGTRLQVRRLSPNCIDAKILTGARNGERVFIPRITLISEDERLPFKLRRRQFPIQVAFAMTINKAQGQSVGRLGIYLRQPVFSHGHMYVALSRCTTRSEIKMVISSAELEEPDGSYTKNIVFQEVINV